MQLIATGGAPDVPVAVPYAATVGSPRSEATVTDGGQAISTFAGSGGGGGGGVGVFGPAQLMAASATSPRSRI
jgi:hypothetical protein